jgi:hypothetical protein
MLFRIGRIHPSLGTIEHPLLSLNKALLLVCDLKTIRRFIDNIEVVPCQSENLEMGCCWMWTGKNNNNYGIFYGTLRHSEGRKKYLAHRLSYLLFHGSHPVNQVGHLCNFRPCVNPAHLEDVTASVNIAEMMRRRTKQGKYGSPADQQSLFVPQNASPLKIPLPKPVMRRRADYFWIPRPVRDSLKNQPELFPETEVTSNTNEIRPLDRG